MIKKFRYPKKLISPTTKPSPSEEPSPPEEKKKDDNQSINKNLEKNLKTLKQIFGKSDDIKYREFEVHEQTTNKMFICFLDGLVDEEFLNMHILKSLLEPNFQKMTSESPDGDFLVTVKKRILSTLNIKEVRDMDSVVDSVLVGETVIFLDGYDTTLVVSTQGFEARGVEEPDTESTVRGPREGFNEVLKVNTALIRRKIINPNLIFENMQMGKQTKTVIRIAYIEDIANPKIVEEVKMRLSKIDTDAILESGYIEQFIEDHPYSIFPTIANSEKPDKVAAKILEGRVAILCDGTPFVLTVPHLLVEAFQVGEDYYSRPFLSSFIRLLRILALVLSVLTPALYVALTTYHQEMVPALLLTTMAAAEEKVPFPAFIEALVLGIVFEILREAGVRMPRPVGSAISIVGALVLGEAAVQAGLVSAPLVIVVALTGMSGFVVTALNDSIILSRLFLLLLAGVLGLYGVLMGALMLLGHMCSLRSFGTPFLAPQAPINWSGWKDSIVRFPLWLQSTRPQVVTWKNNDRREGKHNKPESSRGFEGDERT